MLARSLAHLPSLSLPLVVALVGLACGSSFTTAPFGDATSGAGGTAPTGSSQGGSSGDGGAPCDASDADEDGLSVCEGDCDDANPLVNPSASEICGDLVRNDCKGGGDPVECGGKGTFVATAIGKDTNPGTKTAPLKTVEAGMKSAASLKNGQAVYVAAGDYEPVTHPVISPRFSLREGTSLLGGYRCDSAECTWSRDAKQHVTTLKMSDGVGLFANVGITDKTVVEGFTIVGQDGSAVVNTFRTTVELEGAPTIRGNVIRGPSVGPSGGSVAIRASKPAQNGAVALIVGNRILAGSSNWWTIGVAATGGGRAAIARNEVVGGLGYVSRAVAIGLNAGPTSVVRNRIMAGTCQPGGTSFAVHTDQSVSPTIDSNRINTSAEFVGPGDACDPNTWSGGIEVRGTVGARYTNNVVLGIPKAQSSVGIFVRDWQEGFSNSTPAPIVNANTVFGGDATNVESSALALYASGSSWSAGKFRNNLLLSGASGEARYAVYISATTGSNAAPLAFTHNDLWGSTGLFRTATNQVLTTMATVNSLGSGYAANISVDPKLDATFHLTTDACVNKGTSPNDESPKKDFEDEERPKGALLDIGADEKG